MNRARAIAGAKIAWLTLVAVGLWLFLANYDVRAVTEGRGLARSLLAVLCVCAAHVGVVLSQSQAIAANAPVGSVVGWRTNLRIFNLTNLSKYIPLSGANLAVNGVLINRAGLSGGAAAKALLLMTFWTVAGALAFGAPAAAHLVELPLWAGAVAGALGLLVLVAVRPERWLGIRGSYAPWLQLCGQILIWTGYGTMFALVLWPDLTPAARVAAASAYDLGFGAGLLAVFAPSGVGVREVVVGWTLPELDFQTVIAATLYARLLILAADVTFAVPAYVFTHSAADSARGSSPSSGGRQ